MHRVKYSSNSLVTEVGAGDDYGYKRNNEEDRDSPCKKLRVK